VCIGVPDRDIPVIPEWNSLSETLDLHLSNVWLGQETSKAALDAVAADWSQKLSAAGYTRESPLRFELTTYGDPGTYTPALAELVQSQWKRLGQGVLDVAFRRVDQATFAQVRSSRSFTYMTIGVATLTDPDSYLNDVYSSGGSQNDMTFADPKLDQFIAKQRATFDSQERQKIIKDAVRYMAENSPGVIGANRWFLNGVKPQMRDRAPEFHFKGPQSERVWVDT